MHISRNPFALVLVVAMASTTALGQESFFVDAATLPSPGKVVVRQSAVYRSFGRDESGLGRRGYSVGGSTSVQVGLAPELSLTVDLPVAYRDYRQSPVVGAPAHDHSTGAAMAGAASPAVRITDMTLDDFTVLGKWRVWREDSGPLDTTRLAVLGGVELPSGSIDSSDSVDPVVGLALTAVRRRQGLNVAATYKFSLGGRDYPLLAGGGNADLLRVSASYLYRLSPEEFSATRTTGLYAVLESINTYETSGDTECLLAPGLMFEAPGFAVEMTVQLPVYQQIRHRPQTDVAVGLGVRFTW